MADLKIRKGDFVVFASGLGAYTFSQVLKTPRTQPRAVVDTIDGTIYRRLVRCVEPNRQKARERCDELNMEGART